MRDGTYRLRPMPIASVATSILQGSSGSLNFLACDSLVPVNQSLELFNHTKDFIILMMF